MAKRFFIHKGEWDSIIGRLQELVMANSGEDEFKEIFKLLIAKLYSEKIGSSSYKFRSYRSSKETAKAINALISLAADRWKGIIEEPHLLRLTDEHINVCVEALEKYSILDTSLEVMDSVFEHLVSRAAKGAKGQYFTPRHVIECCVRIIDPSPDEIIIDPACGSGGFLIHALNYIRTNYPSADVEAYCENRLWGFDFEHRAIQVAKALMLIAGDGQANIFRVNSLLLNNIQQISMLEEDKTGIPNLTIEDVVRMRYRKQDGFDVVLTNPPFAGEIKEGSILEGYELYRKGRRLERDVLFLERCIKLLKPGGRIGIVLPYNKLGSQAWAYLREWLYKNLRIVAVLGLGRNTFLPHTHQKASILFGIKRERAIRNIPPEDIIFMISEKEGKDSSGRIINRVKSREEDNIWVKADHDFEEIVEKFHEFVNSKNIVWNKKNGTIPSS